MLNGVGAGQQHAKGQTRTATRTGFAGRHKRVVCDVRSAVVAAAAEHARRCTLPCAERTRRAVQAASSATELHGISTLTEGASTEEDVERSWQHAAYAPSVSKSKAFFESKVRSHVDGNPTGLSVTWLGTSSGCPTVYRNTSSTAVRVGRGPEERVTLVDAGEGATYNLKGAGIDLRSVSQVFITHHHGDHCFGLPALMLARVHAFVAAGEAVSPLHIYGPPGTINLMLGSTLPDTSSWSPGPQKQAAPRVSVTEWTLAKTAPAPQVVERGGISFVITKAPCDQAQGAPSGRPARSFAQCRVPGSSKRNEAAPCVDGLTWTARGVGGLRVQAAQLHHRVPCWGYVFTEASSSDGRPGRKVCILGDTCDSRAIADIAQGCDLLSHEATFVHEMARKAAIATHSTGQQAGAFARQINARQLVLTHFSGRFAVGQTSPAADGQEVDERATQGDLTRLRREAVRAAGPSIPIACAFDGFTWRLAEPDAQDEPLEHSQGWVRKASIQL